MEDLVTVEYGRAKENTQKTDGDKGSDVKSSNKIATDAIRDSYEYRRIEKGVSRTPYEELGGKSVPIADFTGMDIKLADVSAKQYEMLAKEYETTCESIVVGELDQAGAPAGTSYAANTQSSQITFNKTIVKDGDKFRERMEKAVENGQFPKMDTEQYNKYVVTHEFAHTLMDFESPLKNIVNADISHIGKARKEIKSIHESYKAELRELELEFRKAEKEALETFEPSDWEKAQQIEETLNSKKISKYADMNIDEFMADAFADAKIGNNPSEYSKKVEGVIDKYFKKKPVETSLNNGIIKPDKVVCGHDGTPKKADPGMVIDHLGKDNKTETRTFYGNSGYKKKDITNHNHGFPAKHPYGKNGEHAHDYEWDSDGELKNRTTREITEDERKENSDIL